MVQATASFVGDGGILCCSRHPASSYIPCATIHRYLSSSVITSIFWCPLTQTRVASRAPAPQLCACYLHQPLVLWRFGITQGTRQGLSGAGSSLSIRVYYGLETQELPYDFIAPRLRILHLQNITIPKGWLLLTNATNLLSLRLESIPASGYFPPKYLVECITCMPHLENLLPPKFLFLRHGDRIAYPTGPNQYFFSPRLPIHAFLDMPLRISSASISRYNPESQSSDGRGFVL